MKLVMQITRLMKKLNETTTWMIPRKQENIMREISKLTTSKLKMLMAKKKMEKQSMILTEMIKGSMVHKKMMLK